MKRLYEKYKDVIPYLFFGVCTTIVNVIVYWVAAHPLKSGVMLSTILAWLFAVLFAYITNRTWVFHSKANGISSIIKEIISFFACRLATGVVDWLCMWVFVDILGCQDVVVKAAANVVVIVLNYVASKVIIFNNHDQMSGK
jgi:putative flippase GtrA